MPWVGRRSPLCSKRSPDQRSDVRAGTRASAHEVAVRLAALYHLAAIRIERVIDNPLGRIVFVVILEAEMPKAFGDSFESWSLGLMIQGVIGVGAVDDPPKQHQRRIAGQLVFFQDSLKRAFLAV